MPGDPGRSEVLVRLGEDDRPRQRGVQQPGRDCQAGRPRGSRGRPGRCACPRSRRRPSASPRAPPEDTVEARDHMGEVADAAGGDQAEPFDRVDAQTIAARKRVEQPAESSRAERSTWSSRACGGRSPQQRYRGPARTSPLAVLGLPSDRGRGSDRCFTPLRRARVDPCTRAAGLSPRRCADRGDPLGVGSVAS